MTNGYQLDILVDQNVILVIMDHSNYLKSIKINKYGQKGVFINKISQLVAISPGYTELKLNVEYITSKNISFSIRTIRKALRAKI